MNAQYELLKAGGSILALARTMAKLRSKLNEKASDNAKKGYEKAANIKKENKELTQKNIEQVVEKKAPQSFGELARDEEKLPVESKVVEKKAPQRFGGLAGAEETSKQADAPAEKEVVKAKKPVQRFGALAGVEEAPAPKQKNILSEEDAHFPAAAEEPAPKKQKFILSEEGAYSPIKAENTETKIPVDEDVQGLIEVKQKNARRTAAASRARKAYIESKGYENDYPIRDYLPDVSDAELYKAGITKTDLNKLSSILAGNGTESDFQGWFKEHGAEDIPESGVINFGSLRVQEEAANAIRTYIIDKNKYDVNAQEEYDLSKAEEEPEEENYKVWQDEIQDDTQETDRSFSGIVF